MYGCESWTVKKAEHRRIDASELWCWRKLLRVPWTIRRFIYRKSTLNIHWKDGCWSFNTLATWSEELTHLKRPWCWEGLGTGGEGDNRGWDGWMASLTRWTWVWVYSGSCWWTGRPGMLQFMGSQRVRHDWVTEMNSTDFCSGVLICYINTHIKGIKFLWKKCPRYIFLLVLYIIVPPQQGIYWNLDSIDIWVDHSLIHPFIPSFSVFRDVEGVRERIDDMCLLNPMESW